MNYIQRNEDKIIVLGTTVALKKVQLQLPAIQTSSPKKFTLLLKANRFFIVNYFVKRNETNAHKMFF